MKKLITLFLIIGTINGAAAQFKLSGNIKGTTKPDTFYINIPFIFGYGNHDNDVTIPVNAKGNFNAVIKLSQPKFGIAHLKGKALTLLLTPGKALVLNYNRADTNLTFGGTAAPVNRLLDQINLNAVPFFANEDKDNAYARLTTPQLQQQVITPWAAIRDKNIARVQASPISTNDKKLIIQEIKANYILQLSYFARGIMDRADMSRINNLILEVYKDVHLQPDILPAGPLYYSFIDSYIGYRETQIFAGMSREKIKDPNTFIPHYNLTIDSGNRVAKLKGKSFLNWILVRNTYPKNIAEGWLAQNIFNNCSTKDLNYAKPLMDELKTQYPQSKYIAPLQVKMDNMETLLVQNEKNEDIQIIAGYEKMTSIYEAIGKLKGKVVYLDIWGTWCGPCKEELRYNPQLKQHFKGKDVAFVYLDMDGLEEDGQWRDFIKVNGMTGLHLRKSREEIKTFWDELLPKEHPQYYPMYFIFDKDGKLVQANAKRPSDEKELYNQIEQYL